MLLSHAVILGVLQGITEFLPISSSAHLFIVPSLFGWKTQPLVFDTILHLGTAFALLIYFRRDLTDIASSFLTDLGKSERGSSRFCEQSKLFLYICVGSIPAVVLGVFLKDDIEGVFRGVSSAIVFLFIGSILMLAAEKISKKRNESVNLKKSVMVGLFQALALFPGISRSGSTISGGMFAGLSRESAARFSFLLSIPIVVAATGFETLSSYTLLFDANIGLLPLLIGFASSFTAGFLSIKFLLNHLKNKSLFVFIVYRFLLVLFLLFTVI